MNCFLILVCDHSNPSKEVVDNIQDIFFTTECSGGATSTGDPSDIKFSKSNFYNLPIECEVTINLENNYLINKIKIQGQASAFPTEFQLLHSKSNNWYDLGVSVFNLVV